MKPGTISKVVIESYFVPKNSDGTVALISLGDQPNAPHVPVFSSLSKLHEGMRSMNIEFARIGQITNQESFLKQVPGSMRVVIDLHRGEDGKLRYRELLRD